MELSAGTRVGPYEIDRKIGAGGMGVVYGARDDRLGRKVAIKVLPAAVIGDADRLRRFEQEARTVGGLNHPNLVILHDVGRHDGAPYIVTELLSGQSLRARIAEGPLSLRDVVRIAVEVARGLNAAHGSSVVHRDIKPDNIFLTRDSRVKILDFGIAKLRGTEDASTAATAATGSGVVVGTPGYMAPEQLAGGTIDARTDLFALGVVIFEMLARRRPFAAETHVEESYLIMKGAPHALPAGVPAPLSKIVMRCLEKRPDDRFQSAADLAFALDALDDVAAGKLSTPPLGVPIRASSDAFAETATSAPQPAVAAGTGPGTVSTRLPTAPTVAEPRPGTRPLSVVEPPSSVVAPARPSKTLVIALGAACIALAGLGAAGWMRTRATPDQFPSRVTGGPMYTRVSWHSQQKWFARFDEKGENVLFSRRIYDADAQKQKSDWEVVRSAPGASTVLKVGKVGRVLDVDRKTGELALRLADQGDDGGLLARAMVGGADPRPVADRVKDAAWLPSGELVILRSDDQGNTIEYPIDHPLVKPHGREVAALRASADSKLGVIEHLAFDDSAGRVVIYRLDGVELAHSEDYPGIEGIAFAPTGELYFSTNDTIRALAPDGHERVVMRSYGRVQLRDVAADGRMLIAPSDTRYRMYKRINPDQGPPHDEPVEWLDESVAKSVTAKGDALAFLQIADPGHSAEGWAVFLRHAGDTTQLGNAYGVALVPDGSAAVLLCGAGAPLRVVPIPMGGTRTLDTGPIKKFDLNDWIAVSGDGTHAAVRAAGADGEMRLWLVDLSGKSPPVPVGPPSVHHGHHPLSKDSEWIALAAKDGVTFVSTSGKPSKLLRPSPTAGLSSLPTGPFEPLQFSEDGQSIIVMNLHSYPRVILQMSLETGETHELWRFDPPDRPRLFEAAVAADASAMVYSVSSETSDLYVVEPPTR
jgi:serine/threonine protein kinase